MTGVQTCALPISARPRTLSAATHDQNALVINMVELESLSLLGVLRWPVFWVGRQDNTKRPSWFLAKNPRGRSGSFSCGTGGGPHGQSQMINLVNGVVSPPCGHGRHQCEGRRMRNQAPGTGSKNTSGRPVYRFPSGSPLNSPKRLERGKRECLFRARVRQQAFRVLLIRSPRFGGCYR